MFGRKRPRFRLSHHRDLVPPVGCDELVSFGITPAGDAITAWATRTGAALLRARTNDGPNAPSFAIANPDTPVDITAVVHTSGGDEATVLMGVTTSFIHVQVHPVGFLVVGSRCNWRPTAPDHNALVFDASGRLSQTGVFGDGIEHIQTTSSGHAWVGYFDEGVFGNRGWGTPGPAPIGRFGVNRFAPDLELVAHCPDEQDVIDCYAMNVFGESVAACCYLNWDVFVLDHNGDVTSWKNEIAGARALTMADDRVVLVGGYGEDHDRVVCGRLEDTRFATGQIGQLLRADGSSLPTGVHLIGRGDRLHAHLDGAWFVTSIDN